MVGTIKPGTLRCEERGCTATIRAERIEAVDGELSRREAEVDVTFSSSFVLNDRDRVAPSTDVKAALLAVGDRRVRLRGELDFIDRQVLRARRGVRMSADAPPSTAPGKLFSECSPPPWTQAALTQCYAAASHTRSVTVRATLATEALAETSFGDPVTALDLENVSVGDDGFAITPPAPYEIARLLPGAKLGHVAADRSALSTLRVGAQLQLGGWYELPAPASVKGAVEPRCDGDRCWPRLIVGTIRVEKP
ncbi:Hypothetical protein A7982_00397 [Minicystis rosea]|nr:Hypothetical protein A7982_00397 [Minicystis rosea]